MDDVGWALFRTIASLFSNNFLVFPYQKAIYCNLNQPSLNIVATVLITITSLGEGDEDQWHRRELSDERAEERDGGRPVGDGGGEVGDDEEQLVRRVTALRPFVELHARLQQGREGEDDAVHLNQAPVPDGWPP